MDEKEIDDLIKKMKKRRLQEEEDEEEQNSKSIDDYMEDENDEDDNDEDDNDEDDNDEDNNDEDDNNDDEQEDNKKDEKQDEKDEHQEEQDDINKKEDNSQDNRESNKNNDNQSEKGNRDSNANNNDVKSKDSVNDSSTTPNANSASSTTPNANPTSSTPPTTNVAAGGTETTAANGAAANGAAASGAGVAGAGIGVLGIALIVILIVIVLVGIIMFFIAMPGSVSGKIGESINTFRQSVDGFFDGNDAAKIAIGKKEVVEAAQYVSQMGYDLEGFGFLTEEAEDKISAKADSGWWNGIVEWWNENDEDDSEALNYGEFSTELAAERTPEEDTEYLDLLLSEKYDPEDSEKDVKKTIILAQTIDGEVVYAKSKYLTMYLTADNATYMIRNYNTSLWNRMKKILDADDTKEGSGLISFSHDKDVNLDNYVKGATNAELSLQAAEGDKLERYILGEPLTKKATVYRSEKVLRIYNAKDGFFKSTWFDYSLDGWASRYGVPLQLSLALHLSSLAPDFAYEVAKIGAYDTTVEMGLLETKHNTVRMQLDIDLNNDGTTEKYTLEETTAIHIHNDAEGNEEEGYTTIQQAIEESEIDAEEAQKSYNTFEEDYENLKAELENKGDKSIKFGYFLYWRDEDQIDAKNNWNNAKGKGKNAGYIIDVEQTEELQKIVNILISHNLAEVTEDSNGTSRIKIKDEDNENTKKIKKLFTTYFYSGDVIDKQKDIEKFLDITDKNTSNWKSWSTTEKENTPHELENPDKYTIYFDNNDNNNYYVPGVLYSISSTLTEANQNTFWQATIQNIWDWYFNGTELKYDKKWYNYVGDFVGTIDKHIPIRTYYRLVDESGNPVVFDELNAEDFEYISGGNTYYYDEEGWFWRRAIPKSISDTIMHSGGLSSSKEVSEVLDKAAEVETEDYEKYIPFILEVENHWYQDVSFEGAYEWQTDEESKVSTYIYTSKADDVSSVKQASENNILYLKENTPGKLVQIADAKKVGAPGEKIKNLIDNYEYYKYTRIRKIR